jgi:thiol-disulfide isomerase/thioredoxin
VTTLTLATLLQAAILGAGDDSYAEAHRETTQTGKPMVVMVEADWCGPCQNMKNNVLPQVKRRGALARVAFAHVNVDRDPDLVRGLLANGPIPRLIMYRKNKQGTWMRQELVGSQSVKTVEQFINEGLVADDGPTVDSNNNQTAAKKDEQHKAG